MLKIKDIQNISTVIFSEYVESTTNIKGGSIDTRTLKVGDLYFALKGTNSDGHDFISHAYNAGMSAAVVHKDYVNKNKFPVIYSNDVEATLGEVAAIWRKRSNARIIAITGSNGKTTTKEMLYEIIKNKFNSIRTLKNYNNHLGLPLTIMNLTDAIEIAIIEMGANHKGEIRYLCDIADPDIGLITNIGDAHLEFFGSREGVKEAKFELFDHLYKKDSQIFLNTDDELLMTWNKGNIITYGSSVKCDYYYDEIGIDSDSYGKFKFENVEFHLQLPGVLNVQNAIAAVSVSKYLGITNDQIKYALLNYRPYDKRYESVKYKNSEIILDCYNANPSSVEGLLKDMSGIDKNYIYILGDMFELGQLSEKEHSRIADIIQNISFKKILLTGQEMYHCYKKLKNRQDVEYYPEFDQLKSEFEKLSLYSEKIIIKGSRGMKLERLVK